MKVGRSEKAKSANPEMYVEANPFTEGSTPKEAQVNFDRATQKKLSRIVKIRTTNEITEFYETLGLILQVYRETPGKIRDDMVLRHQPFLYKEGNKPTQRNVYKLTVSDGKLKGEIRFDYTIIKVYCDTTSRVWKAEE